MTFMKSHDSTILLPARATTATPPDLPASSVASASMTIAVTPRALHKMPQRPVSCCLAS